MQPLPVRFLASAFSFLLRLCAEARDTETHAYLLGRRHEDELVITTVLCAGNPVRTAFMTRPDYGASALAMQAYLDRGEVLLGEIHRHLTLVGPSTGDLSTLRSIPADRFPGYLGMVITTFPDRDPVITAHSIQDDAVVAHEVTIEPAYPALLPEATGALRLLQLGVGSGASAELPQLAKCKFAGITVVDHDTFEPRNFARHLAPPTADGISKAAWAAAFLRERTTAVVESHDFPIDASTLPRLRDLFATHDLINNSTGHPPTSFLISREAVRANKLVFHSGAFPKGVGGLVFRQDPGGACYECLYPVGMTSEAPAVLAAQIKEYGYTEEELSAQLGLWPDVNLIAAVKTKLIADHLRALDRPNLFIVDNRTLAITSVTINPRTNCHCQEEP